MKDGIAIFVDYENVRMGLQKKFGIEADPTRFANALKDSLKDYGEMRFGKVYGDWSIPHMLKGTKIHTARCFEQAGFTAVMVSTKAFSGQDRSDSRLIIDTIETLYRDTSISSFMVVSGDGDFAHLVRTLKAAGKRVIICALSQTVSQELLAIANAFISVENLLSISTEQKAPTYDWEAFIQQMLTAEKTLPFVSFKYFRDKWLIPPIGPVGTPEERHRLVNEAINLGILTSYKCENPGAPFPTTAIKLNRDNTLVKKYTNGEVQPST